MESHINRLSFYTFLGHLVIANGAIIFNENGRNINVEQNALRDFSSSLRISGGKNEFSLNSAMLHPYLQKLLNNIGSRTRQGGNDDGLFYGVSSEDCKGHLLEWGGRFSSNETDITSDEEKWALHLIDSWGKIPEGILSGHINSMGDFHECIGMKARDIKMIHDHPQEISRNFEGRYCTSYFLDYGSAMSAFGTEGDDEETQAMLESLRKSLLSQNKTSARDSLAIDDFLNQLLNQKGFYVILPSIAVCMPNSCSQLDIQHIMMNLMNATYSNITNGNYFPQFVPWPLVANCHEEKKPDFDAATIIMIILLTVIAILALTSAIMDYWLDKTEREKPTALVFKYFMAFSLYTNTKKWLSTRQGGEDFSCIHGIRFLSTCWVVIGHTLESFVLVPPWNMFDLKNIWNNLALMTLLNATFSVDTFFLMTGALATYSILKMLTKTNGKLNLITLYLYRYLRLTPAYAIAVGINATILNYVGSGPFWSMEWEQQNCRKNWWVNLLYINNLYKLDEMCIGQSWYLSNDMQFFILSPFIIYPIWRKEKIGLILLALYTALSCISPVLVVHLHGAPPAMIMTGNIDGKFKEIYFRPWPRIQTFLVGVWLGWLLYKTRGKKIVIPRMVVIGLWLCSTGAVCAVIFGIQPWFDPNYEIPKVAGYFYAAFSRFTWAISISWIIFACIKGYGGIVNSLLSWKAFMPLGRLSYCVYLTSMTIQYVYHQRLTQPMTYDNYTVINIYFGHLLMSNFVGFIFTLLFESPFIILQKLIFEGDTSRPKKENTKEKADS